MRTSWRRSFALAFALVLVAGLSVALAGDNPLADLERGLRELEGAVRAIHEARLEAVREAERGRATTARLEAEARDLEREASAIEDEAGPLRAQVVSLERERDAIVARRTRLEADRDALARLVPDARPSPGVALAEKVRALESDLERTRTISVESDGSVRVGAARVAAGADAARAIADQIAKRAHPALVRAPLEIGERPSR